MAIYNTGLTKTQISTAFDRALNYDSLPTKDSIKFVTSGGVYSFVNSSVATNTANFIGTFNSVEDLEAYSGTLTNNDYAFVVSTDTAGNTVYNRYKYNASSQEWLFEYALNNSSFTAAQWETINSGMVAADKTKIDTVETGANKTIVDSALSTQSANPVQNQVITTSMTAMTQAQYEDLQSYDYPLYFIYET